MDTEKATNDTEKIISESEKAAIGYGEVQADTEVLVNTEKATTDMEEKKTDNEEVQADAENKTTDTKLATMDTEIGMVDTKRVTTATKKVTSDTYKVQRDPKNVTIYSEKEMLDQIVRLPSVTLTKSVLSQCADRNMTLTIPSHSFDIEYHQEAASFQDGNSTKQDQGNGMLSSSPHSC